MIKNILVTFGLFTLIFTMERVKLKIIFSHIFYARHKKNCGVFETFGMQIGHVGGI